MALTAFSHAGLSEAAARANLTHAMMLSDRWGEARREHQLALASRDTSQDVQSRLAKMGTILEQAPKQSTTVATTDVGDGQNVQVQFEQTSASVHHGIEKIPAF